MTRRGSKGPLKFQRNYRGVVVCFTALIILSVVYIHRTSNLFEQHVFPLDYNPSEEMEQRNSPEMHVISRFSQPSLCSRVKRNPEKCRQAILEALRFVNITCPAKCITFKQRGRFSNNVIQISNAIAKYVDPLMVVSTNRRSVCLHHDFREYVDAYFDLDQLAKVCVFPSWYPWTEPTKQATCTEVDAAKIYYEGEKRHHGLRLAWLLVGAIRIHVQEENTLRSAVLGSGYSAVHVRFLENTCHWRHWKYFLPSDICDLSPTFVKASLVSLGHRDETIIVCSDMQKNSSVQNLVRVLNATMSPSHDLYSDLMLMLYSKRFVGNIVSSFSVNVVQVRHTIFGEKSLDVVK